MGYRNSRAREAIAEFIHSERDRRLMERRLIDGVTFERLAEELDMSVRQVKNIYEKLRKALFMHIPDE